jgi:hypothetical protein
LNTQVGFDNSGIFTNPTDESKVVQSKYSAHYEVPNLSSSKFIQIITSVLVLYEYTMKEQNVVQGAFRVGNHFSLRDLPTLISPFNVCEALKDSQQDGKLMVSVNSENKKVEREILKENGGIFMKFAWKADPFDADEESRMRKAEMHKFKAE